MTKNTVTHNDRDRVRLAVIASLPFVSFIRDFLDTDPSLVGAQLPRSVKEVRPAAMRRYAETVEQLTDHVCEEIEASREYLNDQHV